MAVSLEVLGETTEAEGYWLWMLVPVDNIAYAQQWFFEDDKQHLEGVKLFLKAGRPGHIQCRNLTYDQLKQMLGTVP